VIRHVSVLTFADGTTDDQVAAIEAALATLPVRLAVRRYEFGPDLELAADNASFGIVADFETLDGYLAYRDDPEHRRILAELIRPVLAGRAAVQYEIV
jgi:hypothetical protein